MSSEQRFFLAFAQGWREKTRPESLRQQVQSDPHAPPVYRVLGPLANTAAFAEAFQCNANAAALRPAAKRTVIW